MPFGNDGYMDRLEAENEQLRRLADTVAFHLGGEWEKVHIGTPHYRRTITLPSDQYERLREALDGLPHARAK